MTRTINIKLDGESVFKLEISGTDEIVTQLTEDIFFKSMLRTAAEDLVKDSVKKKVNK